MDQLWIDIGELWSFMDKNCQRIVVNPKMSTIFSKIVHKQCLYACNFFRVCWRSLIKRIDGISGLRKCFTENLRQSHFNSGWGCGEALNPWFKRNLHYRLETSAVLFEDNSSSMYGGNQAPSVTIYIFGVLKNIFFITGCPKNGLNFDL